jgi:hypothetical protein
LLQAAEGLRSMTIEAGDEIGAEYKAPGQYVQVRLHNTCVIVQFLVAHVVFPSLCSYRENFATFLYFAVLARPVLSLARSSSLYVGVVPRTFNVSKC